MGKQGEGRKKCFNLKLKGWKLIGKLRCGEAKNFEFELNRFGNEQNEEIEVK